MKRYRYSWVLKIPKWKCTLATCVHLNRIAINIYLSTTWVRSRTGSSRNTVPKHAFLATSTSQNKLFQKWSSCINLRLLFSELKFHLKYLPSTFIYISSQYAEFLLSHYKWLHKTITARCLVVESSRKYAFTGKSNLHLFPTLIKSVQEDSNICLLRFLERFWSLI